MQHFPLQTFQSKAPCRHGDLGGSSPALGAYINTTEKPKNTPYSTKWRMTPKLGPKTIPAPQEFPNPTKEH
eukprot:3514711-Amphidinium_carterae.1